MRASVIGLGVALLVGAVAWGALGWIETAPSQAKSPLSAREGDATRDNPVRSSSEPRAFRGLDGKRRVVGKDGRMHVGEDAETYLAHLHSRWGMFLRPIEGGGTKVETVTPDYPAFLAGVKVGDEVIAVNETRRMTFEDILLTLKKSDTPVLRIMRGEREIRIELRDPRVPADPL